MRGVGVRADVVAGGGRGAGRGRARDGPGGRLGADDAPGAIAASDGLPAPRGLGEAAELLRRGVLPRRRRPGALGDASTPGARAPGRRPPGRLSAIAGLGRGGGAGLLGPALHGRQPGPVPVRPRHAGALRALLGGDRVRRPPAPGSGRALDPRRRRLVRGQRGRRGPLQGVDGARPRARPRPRPGARAAAPGDRGEHRAPSPDLRARRGLVPHERDRGGDGGGAAGALQHPASADRVLRGGLSRVVGRRAAGPRQRAAPDGLPHPEGPPSRLARRDPPASRGDRGGAGQPGAVLPSERAAAQRRDLVDQRRAPHRGGLRALPGVAAAPPRGVPRGRRPADLRRGLHRLPPRSRRRAGVLRGDRGHGGVRQDGGRRHAHRGGLRHQGPHAALRPGAPHAPRLRDRDVLRPPGGHGGDERVPALARRSRPPRASTRR